MDPLLAANRLPKLAVRAMRAAVLRAVASSRATPRTLIDDALMRFECAVQREATDGVRPALLFAERDRIVRELRTFMEGRLAARLVAMRGRDVVAFGRNAAPFDAIVRGRRGGYYAIVFRRWPRDGRRLEMFRRTRAAAERYATVPLRGVVAYDFAEGVVHVVTCGDRMSSIAA